MASKRHAVHADWIRPSLLVWVSRAAGRLHFDRGDLPHGLRNHVAVHLDRGCSAVNLDDHAGLAVEPRSCVKILELDRVSDSQAYFTPFCDVVLRFESLKRDFDGLMAKIGCPLRLPPARENRGNRLLPLLADDVVASVRRMYADDYSLVKRLAGLDLDDLLANATRLI